MHTGKKGEVLQAEVLFKPLQWKCLLQFPDCGRGHGPHASLWNVHEFQSKLNSIKFFLPALENIVGLSQKNKILVLFWSV